MVDRYGDPLPEGAVARLGTVRLRPGAAVCCLAFSPDGKVLVEANWGRGIHLYDVATGKELRQFVGATRHHTVAFSDRGKALFAFGGDPKTLLWDVSTGRELRQSSAPLERGSAGALSPDGAVLALSKGDHTVRLCDAATGVQLRSLTGFKGDVESLAWSPDGKTVAAGNFGTKIHLWEADTGRLARVIAGHGAQVTSLAWSADGKTLASGSHDGTARLWDVATGKEIGVFGKDPGKMLGPPGRSPRPSRFPPVTGGGLLGAVLGLALTPDGKSVITGSSDYESVIVWDVATGRERLRMVPGERVYCLALSADGKTLATGSTEGQIDLWDPATGRLLRHFDGHPGRADSVAWSPDGKSLASGGPDGVCYWEAGTWRQTGRRDGPGDYNLGIVVSPDGKLLASGGMSDTLWLWDRASGKEVRTFANKKTYRSRPIAFSPDGTRLVAFVEHLAVWDVATGKELYRIDADIGPISPPPDNTDVVFSPDGKTVLAAGPGGVVTYEAAGGKAVRRFALPGRLGVSKVLLSPDGRELFTVGEKTARLWEVVTGKELRRFEGHASDVLSLSLSPYGRILATASGRDYDRGDDTVRLWDVATGKELRRLTGHRNAVGCVAFAPDGKTLASAGRDGQVLVWDAAVPHLDRLVDAEHPSPEALEALWADLAGDDAPRAHRSLWALASDPEQAVPLLRHHLRAAAFVDENLVRRRVADLDSNDFATRERATEQLRDLDDLAEPILRRVLAGAPSAEVRRRLGQLVGELEGSLSTPVALRTVRGVELLERCGTPAARQLLETLAAGAPAARLTREAKSAVQRLAARPAAAGR
jgi:WD40 repeat protein